jgi:type II secretory pathway pseudopilin PulG
MIVVVIIGVLAALAVPNFMKVRATAQTKTCIGNLGQIESAKQIWGLENGKVNGDTPAESELIPDYIKVMPLCPAHGAYEFRPIGENAACTVEGHTL